jgi:hypothetical protein
MKITLGRPFLGDNGDPQDYVSARDYISVGVMRAGNRHSTSDERASARIQAWVQLTEKEFDLLSYQDYLMLASEFSKLLPKDEEAQEPQDPKADTYPPATPKKSKTK